MKINEAHDNWQYELRIMNLMQKRKTKAEKNYEKAAEQEEEAWEIYIDMQRKEIQNGYK